MTLDLELVRETMVANIRVGDRVTILVPNGQHIDHSTGKIVQEWAERTGKAIICARPWEQQTHVALNMGGRFGTPGVATPQNIVRINSRKDARR